MGKMLQMLMLLDRICSLEVHRHGYHHRIRAASFSSLIFCKLHVGTLKFARRFFNMNAENAADPDLIFKLIYGDIAV